MQIASAGQRESPETSTNRTDIDAPSIAARSPGARTNSASSGREGSAGPSVAQAVIHRKQKPTNSRRIPIHIAELVPRRAPGKDALRGVPHARTSHASDGSAVRSVQLEARALNR